MEHTLTLEIPQTIYEPLAKTAKQTGRTPEELALDWLAAASRTVIDDPIENFIGAFKTNMPDWTDHHDKYIGQALIKQMQSKDDEGK